MSKILKLSAIVTIIVILNFVSSKFYFRIDLTKEKRYTLSSVTRSFLKNLDDDVLVKVYLTGDLNVGFTKLSKATREMLDEFRRISGKDFYYELIDPSENPDEQTNLQEFGFQFVPVYETMPDGRKIQSRVYPYAIIQMSDYEIGVNLLENLPGLSGAENLNISMESLEYKFADALRRLATDDVPAIAFLEGHGELDELDVVDITNELSAYYQVDRGSLTDDPFILDNYKAVIIAKPQEKFSQQDKFIIDQYIMRGGSVLWLIDAINVTLDTLRKITHTAGLIKDINLSDQLFRYGIRINPILIQDIQSALIPINVSRPGETPQIVPVPWLFSPLLNTALNHPITRNINVVKSEFVSSIDTVGNLQGIQKDVLLRTGRYSRELPTPVYISLSQVNDKPEREDFRKSQIPVAISLEGIFQSAFANRPIPPGVNIKPTEIRYTSQFAKMIVVADGDIIRNEIRLRHSGYPQIVPLGYDEISNQTFGNKQFIINAVNYLTDDAGWMDLRSRSYELRLLDKEKLANELGFWKTLNLTLPILIVVISGLTVPIWRKRKFG